MFQKTNSFLIGMILYHAMVSAQEHVIADFPCASNLDELGRRYQTDKAYFHHYTPIYEQYLDELRNKPINFLEIGFYHGASAHMWDNYFVNAASLHFIDIDHTENYA